MSKIVNVVLVRHGETLYNVKRLMQGQSDSKLSEIGLKQAEILGNVLADEVFTRIFSSDLARAFDTTTIAMNQSRTSPPNIVKDVRLRERGFGVYEGLHVSVLFEDAKKLGLLPYEMTPEGAETFEELTERVVDWMQLLFDRCDGQSEVEENVLAVTHGGTLKAFMMYLHAHPELFTLSNFDLSRSRIVSGNTGVTRVQIGPVSQNGTRSIVFLSLNDTSHLKNKDAGDEEVPSIFRTTVNDGV